MKSSSCDVYGLSTGSLRALSHGSQELVRVPYGFRKAHIHADVIRDLDTHTQNKSKLPMRNPYGFRNPIRNP